MPEQVQKILNRILEWWKKFNTKQKALLISSTAVVLVALVILGIAVSKPTYVPLVTCEDTSKASEVKSVLDGDGSIDYKVSDDGLTFQVNQKNESTAKILLGQNNIPSEGFSIDDAVNGSFSTTEADKQKRYKVYLEDKFAKHLESLGSVKSANVDLTLPDDDGTILSKDEQAKAAVTLELSGDLSEDQAYGIARFIATEIGNESTDGITILDQNANVLYSGADSDSAIGTASTQLSYKQKQENMVKNKIKDVLVETKIYSNVEVAPNLDINFDNTETATHEYSAPDGQTDGMVSSKDEYEQETTNSGGGTPGTDSNDADSYVTQDNDNSSSTTSETKTQYQNNEKTTKTTNAGGNINYDSSSVSIVCTRYVVYDEETMDKAGELKDTTFDEFVAQNSDPVQVDVDDSLKEMIANATGFSTDSITILCYQQPEFHYKDKSSRTLTDIFQIALAVLIFALLGYVVFRSTRKEPEPEMEPELSVESLLSSTAEAQQDELEDIGYNEKSETRLLIEKFVDENPNAAALLLRNWLNEDWE